MFGTMNLDLVRARQADLQREAAAKRLAARATKAEPQKRQGRRVLGLRLSLA